MTLTITIEPELLKPPAGWTREAWYQHLDDEFDNLTGQKSERPSRDWLVP